MDQFNFADYPNTDFNEINLSWMLEVMTQFKEDIESGQFVGPQGPQGPKGDPGPAGDGITEEVKQALLQLARKVAYIDDQGQTYYQDLYDALYGTTPTELVSISAAYTQIGTVYDTDSLDSLKADLVVTATYSDSSTAVIPAADYTLSGSLTVGTSTITVSYQGKTATFQVTVTASGVTLVSISAAFNQGSAVIYDTDSLDTLRQYLVVTATYSNSSIATVTDYTLSGTLTKGTSTITVSYGGKNATFSVIVTDSRALPTQYTWLYEASNEELLSAESYISYTLNGSGTETLTGGYLVIQSPVAVNGQTNYHRFNFSDTTTSNGKLSCRAKLTEATYIDNKSIGFRLQLSNGTSGAQAFFMVVNNKLTVAYYEGSTLNTVKTNYSITDFHVFELELSNGKQSLKIDGNQVFETLTLSTNYCTANAIFNMSGSSYATPNGITTTIDWVAYYEVA